MATQVRARSGDRRLQIMEAARRLFARRGFEGTTTRRIAERARVNEAIIFRHFSSKEELYRAIIDHQCEVRGGLQALQARLRSGEGDRAIFTGLARDILLRRAQDDTLSRLVLFSALESRQRSQRIFRSHVAEYYEMLAEYIRGRIAQGAFRPVDPMLAARGFLGMVVYHSLIQDLFGAKRHQDFDVEEVSETLADIWLGGMAGRNRRTPRATPGIQR